MCGSIRHDNKLVSTVQILPAEASNTKLHVRCRWGVELHDRGRGCKIRPDLKPKGGTGELPRETIDMKEPWQRQGNDQPWQQDL